MKKQLIVFWKQFSKHSSFYNIKQMRRESNRPLYSFSDFKLKLCSICGTDTGGLEGLKPIYGIKGPGIPLRRRRESKVDVELFLNFTFIGYLLYLVFIFDCSLNCCSVFVCGFVALLM